MRIGIIGGGIGGLTAAVALQSDGHTVTVYERRADAGAVGTGLTLFGNAFAALDAIELGDLVREVSSTAVGRLRSGQRQPSGRWLVALPPSDAPGVRSLHRSDLHQALVTRLAPGTLRLGEAARVSEDGAPIVTVNRNEEQFDLVVAADGIRGEARARWGLDPASATPDTPPRAASPPPPATSPTKRARPGGEVRASGSCRCPTTACTGSRPATSRPAEPTPTPLSHSAATSAPGTPRSLNSSTRPRHNTSSGTTSTTSPASRAPSFEAGACCSATPPTR
ncbi:NAD(P)-binding protein [Kytococcus sedentarius]|uniref:NAD(P)-binding protein n=1 Tax=Kytococcus sedentarius TaxID=1276 RepID=UPI0009D64790|nr:NAD(P)-binding protein [Kytococcus sedentarius]STX13812.1 3-hydroxybenzoate 6-hydroxylase 1 [Kytococcus sedentarius]